MEQADILIDTRCSVREGVLWHPVTQKLYWIDTTRGHLFRYDPVADECQRIYEGAMIGGLRNVNIPSHPRILPLT
ncbi:MAG: SMP-30/gluconolactonase/LRE family protein, partial [Gammaproteobacteria bacterium]|nr:SMP-30/gluconolactonase/LRE family protein [Gammaproteobacteria bacterium]